MEKQDLRIEVKALQAELATIKTDLELQKLNEIDEKIEEVIN